MSRETMLRVTAELAALQCQRITLSGGEPSLSPHWQAIASEGARLGIKMNMITNAVSGGKAFVADAKNSGLVNLGVSLDGIGETHDKLRGLPGLYNRVLQLFEDCAAIGLPIGVVTTICKSNFRQLDQIHDLIKGKAFVWQLQIGAAMGNLLDHRYTEQVRPDDLLEIVPELARLIKRREVNIQVADNVGYYGPYEDVLRTSRKSPLPCWVGCYAGCRHMGIESDGGVKGCLSIQASTATEGNLQKDSLQTIWNRKGAFAYTREFKLDDLTGFCRTCEHASICRGGCLSMRTCEGGGENPFCYHRVATLAERKKPSKIRSYVPLAIAPSALLALLGIGCGGSTSSDEAVALYATPCPDDASCTSTDAGTDGQSDAQNDITAKYGIDAPDDTIQYTDAYGIADAGQDTEPATYYGIATPDAADVGTLYGIDAAEDSMMPTDAYGVDVPLPDTGTGDKYGIPTPDGG
jgi:radical SAM protein with 4Fe4S-binding SPASM domain